MPPPQYKFQKLDVYQLGLEFVDKVYGSTNQIPDSERFNLRSQLERAATSIVLNIAEGSTGQSNLEQNRFLGMALRSYLETVACMDLIERRGYLEPDQITSTRELGHSLFVKLQALRRLVKRTMIRRRERDNAKNATNAINAIDAMNAKRRASEAQSGKARSDTVSRLRSPVF